MIIGRNLIENEYYEDQRLYSTGDDELDELLERAFCEGYSYAQKEFAVSLGGVKNKIKAIPRHIKRNFKATNLLGKMIQRKPLNNEELGLASAVINNTSRRMKAGKDKLGARLFKASGSSLGELESVAELMREGYKRGNSLVPDRVFGGYTLD